MDPALAQPGWTEDQWNRICTTVTEEAQKARVAAQILPIVGTDDPSAVSVPRFAVERRQDAAGNDRLSINSDPDLYLTRISVNVELRSQEFADPSLNAGLQKFRRAASIIARVEDALIFYGRRDANPPVVAAPQGENPPFSQPRSVLNAPSTSLPVFGSLVQITSDRHNVGGIFTRDPLDPRFPPDRQWYRPGRVWLDPLFRAVLRKGARGGLGEGVANTIVSAIDAIESRGYFGPFACALGHTLFEAICSPSPSLVLPRDRILPFLQGPLLRASSIEHNFGIVIALGASPVEIVVASPIHVKFLQTDQHSNRVFRVTERIALRIRDQGAIQQIAG